MSMALGVELLRINHSQIFLDLLPAAGLFSLEDFNIFVEDLTSFDPGISSCLISIHGYSLFLNILNKPLDNSCKLSLNFSGCLKKNCFEELFIGI